MDHMKQDNSDMNNESMKSGNTFQGENKKSSAHKSGGCGCGCKSAPVEDEVVEIDEEDVEY